MLRTSLGARLRVDGNQISQWKKLKFHVFSFPSQYMHSHNSVEKSGVGRKKKKLADIWNTRTVQVKNGP